MNNQRTPSCPDWCEHDHRTDNPAGDVINHLGTIATIPGPGDEPIRLQITRSDLPTGDKLTSYSLAGYDYDAGEIDLPADPDALDQLAAAVASVAASIRDSTRLS